MTAPALWIFLPLAVAGVLLLLKNAKAIFLGACLFLLFLTLAAWLLPIDTALSIGRWTFKVAPSFEILGRNLTLTSADRAFLALIYGSGFFWFIPTASLQIARRMIPIGLAITSLLVAAISVEPFLYAALLIELAVLLSIPLLTAPSLRPGRGVTRFLIFQTLAVPFILIAGWLLAGIGANPGNLTLIQQAAILLGLGFALLLAVFPFYTWIPLMVEEAHPYMVGFLFWILPTVTLFFGLGFLERYSWLRDSSALPGILTTVGALMVISGGLFSAFQRHLGRIMGYATIAETGYSLIALGLVNRMGLNVFYLLLVPRCLSLCLWALSLSILRKQAPSLRFDDVNGMGRAWPFAASGLLLANLALAGLPILAGFPAHQAIWDGLARSSLPLALWVLIGTLGLFAGAARVLSAISSPTGLATWSIRETRAQQILVTIGLLGLILLGVFPQWALPLWTKLPAIFEHLGQ